ncbi:MAG: hypothetical protein J6K96_06555 [Treponema sp.]|nr:hypothetical protein [Treponema sp.]
MSLQNKAVCCQNKAGLFPGFLAAYWYSMLLSASSRKMPCSAFEDSP